MAGQMGPRPAAVAALPDLPAAASSHGDLGHLDRLAAPGARTTSRQFAPATLELATVGVPARRSSSASRSASWRRCGATAGSITWRALISLIGVSSPTFWLAFIMLAVFYGGLQIAPGPGRLDPIAFAAADRHRPLPGRHASLAGDWETFRDAPAHLVLPSIVLAAATLGLITRTTRASMLESMQQDYVRVARAKGLRERTHRDRPRAAERADPGRDARRPRLCEPADRRGDDRDDLLLAGARPLHLPQRRGARFSRPSWASRSIVAVVYLVINLLIDISYALLDPRVVR